MRATAPLLLAALLLAGCARPIAPFSPRRPGTPDHRAAKVTGECRGCHDPAQLPRHGGLDDCLGCHRLVPGG